MQNFTFGRKSHNWFLLAFLLFIGNLSSFGQTPCATVTDEDSDSTNGNQQSFCYLATVDDIERSGTNTAVFETADTTNDTDPIPGDEILTNGVTYYVGSTTEDCDRVAVEVTVDSVETPDNTLFPGRDNFTLSPCISSGFSVGDLEDLFNTSYTDYKIEVYDSEFGTTPLDESIELVRNESYFVAQVYDDTVADDTSSDDTCPSTRAAVGYNPTEAPSPNAEANQTFCESATVADLVATGTEENTQAIRWYRSMTSSTPLADDVELINGEDYFASQIVNDRNDPFPPCETEMSERTQVIVTLTEGPDAGPDNVGVVCLPDVQDTFPSEDAVRNFLLGLLADGVPTTGTFSPTIGQLVNIYGGDADGLGDFTTTYTIGEGDCQDSVDLTIRVIDESPANAGSYDDIPGVCVTDDPIDLTALTNNDPDATMGGTFSGTGVTANQFDPSTGEGEYTITYTVDETSAPCTTGTDSTTFTIFVDEANAGTNITETACSSNLEDPSSFAATINGYLSDGRDTDGTFSPDLSTIYAQYQSDLMAGTLPQTYSTTYTVGEGSCQDEAEVNVTVNPSPDAGEDGTADLESTDDPVNLFDYLNGDPDTGGTWSPGNPDGSFDPATDSAGTYTYTVTNSFDCSDSADVIVNVNSEECTGNEAGADKVGVVCEDDVQATFPSVDETRKYILALRDSGVPSNGTFNPTITQLINSYNNDADGLGDFTTTYTVTVDGCTDSAELTVRVVENEEANAGSFNDINDVCTGDEMINLTTLTNNNPDAQSGGTFSGTGVSGNMFDPSTGQGSYTITYMVDDSTGCIIPGDTDSTDFTINVVEGDADAGEDGTANLNDNDDPVNLFDYLNGDPDTGGTWSPGNSDGSFDPATDPEGDYMYTVTDGDCSDSAIVSVNIESDTDCTGNEAGKDNFGVVCLDDVQATFPSVDETRKYILALRDSGVPSNGTFNPTITQLINSYNNDTDGLGDFSTIYTVTVNGCTDSTELTVRVVEEGPANAGSFDDIEDVCSDEDVIDLDKLINNDPDATIGGTFTGTGVSDNEFDPSIGAGTYTITYAVDDSTPCTTGSDSTSFVITVEEAPVSASISRTLCVTEAQTLLDDDAALTAFLNTILTEAGVDDISSAGFDMDDLAEGQALLAFIATPTLDSETFNFSYVDESATTVCNDGIVNIQITINDERDAEAGTIEDQNVCETDGMIDLSIFLGSDSISGGTFSGTSVSGGMFDTSVGSNDGGYEITYTVDDSVECVTAGTSDSTTFNIFVNEGVNAGEPNSGDVCRANVDDLFPSDTAVRNYYLNLLSDGVPRNGTFNPTITQLITDYNANPDQDVFTTTYTISNGGCSDSVDLTINVYDSLPAVIGDIEDQTYCRNAQDVTLVDLLPEDANPNGTFEGYADGIFSPGMEGVGTFDITYTLTDDSPCTEGEASATFTITVTESAFAGMDMDLSVCMDAGVQNLFDFLSTDADTTGEFTLDGDVIADGMMDPSGLAAGEYEVIYTVPSINDCGEDTATFTITVEEAPAAPTVEGNPFTFCATDMATVADLSATGTNLTYYSDAELSIIVMAEDELETGTYYVTQRNDDGACESEAAEITVTVNDADTPTISSTTQEFCEYDDATIADLSAEINETGTITWYDSASGDNALNSGTPLQNGVTYYATLLNVDTGCESSTRLAVSVTLTDCPLLFPEGFSPNGDGINDTFDIENIEDEYPNYTIEIYNRWGDSVYKGNANTPEWDGYSSDSSFGDNVLPVGVYFYYLNFNDGSTEPMRGKVYLSR